MPTRSPLRRRPGALPCRVQSLGPRRPATLPRGRAGIGTNGARRVASWLLLLCAAAVLTGCSKATAGPSVCPIDLSPPYAPSPVIRDIAWDFASLVRVAPGSDLWPITWAADDNLYTSFGDGGGFGGTNSDGRVSLGFARISGFPPDFTGRNVWGGKDALAQPTFRGKSAGMLSVGGTLYAWVNMQNALRPDMRLASSQDLGRSWELSEWRFPGRVGAFYPTTFLNFGRDYAGARDGFVYAYGKRWSAGRDPFAGNDSYLVRVPREMLNEPGAYEFFTGLAGDCTPQWTSDIAEAAPVLSDPNEIDPPNVVFSFALGRYIATTAREQQVQKLTILDAPEPWGPWTVVSRHESWGNFGPGASLVFALSTKWMSADGTTVWMVFSSVGELDSFNLIRGTLNLVEP